MKFKNQNDIMSFFRWVHQGIQLYLTSVIDLNIGQVTMCTCSSEFSKADTFKLSPIKQQKLN